MIICLQDPDAGSYNYCRPDCLISKCHLNAINSLETVDLALCLEPPAQRLVLSSLPASSETLLCFSLVPNEIKRQHDAPNTCLGVQALNQPREQRPL